MAKTEFSISFVDNIDSCNQISFVDLSTYNTDIEINNPIVKILYPDSNIAESLSYTPLSTNVIKVPTGDGLYTIELSVNPNTKLKKVFYYYQVCCLMNKIKVELCKYSGNVDKINDLMDLFKYTLATQLVATDSPEKAKVMYQFVNSKLC